MNCACAGFGTVIETVPQDGWSSGGPAEESNKLAPAVPFSIGCGGLLRSSPQKISLRKSCMLRGELEKTFWG